MYVLYALAMIILVLLPIWHLSTPVKVWSCSWAASWVVHAMLAPVYYVSEGALFHVFIGNVAFVIGYYAFRLVSKGDSINAGLNLAAVERYGRSEPSRTVFVYGLFALSAISLLYGLQQLGGGVLSVVRGGGTFFEIMRQGQASMYDGDQFAVPAGIKLATVFICATAIVAGMKYAAPINQRGIGWKFGASFALLVFVLSASSGVRSYILVAGLFSMFSFLAVRVFLAGGKNVISKRLVGYSSITLCVFLTWVVVVQSARLQDAGFSNIRGTIEHMRPWFAGYFPALSVWFDSSASDSELGFGKYLLRGVIAPLGLATGEGFDERIYITSIGNGQTSNAMTVFRVVWADFSYLGGGVFCLAAGFACAALFRAAMHKGRHWLVALCCVYCAVFFSINYWFFAYGSRVLGAVLAALLVSLSFHLPSRVRWK